MVKDSPTEVVRKRVVEAIAVCWITIYEPGQALEFGVLCALMDKLRERHTSWSGKEHVLFKLALLSDQAIWDRLKERYGAIENTPGYFDLATSTVTFSVDQPIVAAARERRDVLQKTFPAMIKFIEDLLPLLQSRRPYEAALA